MKKKENPKSPAPTAQIMEQAGNGSNNSEFTIAKDNKAKVRLHDGSLEVTLLSLGRPTALIDSPRAPGISVELVDHQNDYAPPDAIYCITAYMPNLSNKNAPICLNGDVYQIYVGSRGIILDDSARKRVAEILSKKL